MILFVTTNPGKFREVSALLAARGVEVSQLDRTYPEVQSDRLEDVVTYAVGALAAEVEGDFFLDDSGLFVEHLRGYPGVYSNHAFRTIGIRGVLCLMEGVQDRRARFETVIGARVGGRSRVARGECRGTLTGEPRGTGGFGFDPIFVPEGHDRTFAEMDVEEKNAVSHRGNAARALAALLKGR